MRLFLLAGCLAACAGDPVAEQARSTTDRAPVSVTRDAASALDARPAFRAVDAPPTTLGGAGFARAAEIIEARVAQSSPKMKLSPDQGARAADLVLAQLGRSDSLRALYPTMPHSVVELARAVGERGLEPDHADGIASYLLQLTATLRFERLQRFDINHSHVTGRRWREIDYRGENMTWQEQRAYWSKRGVADFRRAAHVHAYMRGASRMPHFARVYRPRGRFSDVRAP